MFNSNIKMTLCRTCLDSISQDDIVNIFDTMDLANKLIICFGQSVESSDEYPVNVCQPCYEQILLFYEFKQMCCKSLVTFKELLNDIDTDIEENEEEAFRIEILSKDPLNAKFGGLTENAIGPTDNTNILRENMEKKKRGRQHKRKPEDRILERKTVIKRSSRSVIQKYISAEQDLSSEESVYYIDIENGIDDDKNEETMTNHVPNNFETADLCNEKRTKSKETIKNKTGTDTESCFIPPQKQNKHQCDRCNKTFNAPHRLEAHEKQHDGLPPYTCTLEGCNRSFNRWHFYNKHQKEHNLLQERIFKCDLNNCERVYKNKSALNIHKRKFHNFGPELKTHMCEICGKVFKSSAVLNDHHYTHIDKTQLPFACEEHGCAKRFSNKEKLKIHKMRHAGIKNFICPHCGMRKTTRNELKIHINYHTLEKTWPCRFCPKVCNSAGNLKMHVKNIHERAKDFACRYCERTFAKADTKKYHEMTHTGEKPNECKECGRRFVQPAALRTHRKIHLREKGNVSENRKRKVAIEAEEIQNNIQDTGEETLITEAIVAEILCDTNESSD